MISNSNRLNNRDKNLNWNWLILLSTGKITIIWGKGGGAFDCFFRIQFVATRNIFNFCIIYFIKFQQSITFLLIFTNSGCFIEKCSFLNLFHNNYLWCKIQWYPITRVELPKVKAVTPVHAFRGLLANVFVFKYKFQHNENKAHK